MPQAVGPYSVEERVVAGGTGHETSWVAIRARGAEWSWLTPVLLAGIVSLTTLLPRVTDTAPNSLAQTSPVSAATVPAAQAPVIVPQPAAPTQHVVTLQIAPTPAAPDAKIIDITPATGGETAAAKTP